jgi:pectin methylesterase-like acyl-CoA thioesterase
LPRLFELDSGGAAGRHAARLLHALRALLLRPRVISDTGFDTTAEAPPVHAILQRGRAYFENRDATGRVRAAFGRGHRVFTHGVVAAEVYAR